MFQLTLYSPIYQAIMLHDYIFLWVFLNKIIVDNNTINNSNICLFHSYNNTLQDRGHRTVNILYSHSELIAVSLIKIIDTKNSVYRVIIDIVSIVYIFKLMQFTVVTQSLWNHIIHKPIYYNFERFNKRAMI